MFFFEDHFQNLAFYLPGVAKFMKALFAQRWKGPPEFICSLHWCFPCRLKELSEEVVWLVHTPSPLQGL